MLNGDLRIYDIYLEDLRYFSANDETNMIKMLFGDAYEVKLEITLWEVFNLNMSCIVK